jgi:hypothetical protein
MRFGTAISALAIAISLVAARPARAEVAAAWAEGHGGMTSAPSESTGPMGGLGFQLGARLLLFEGYLDHTAFGEGASVTRGIFGLRGGIGSSQTRLVLRGGLGLIQDQSGALTGRVAGFPERRGGVARAGVALETHLAPLLLAGFGIDAERFVLANPGPDTGYTTGSDVFASLHLMFELGI